ncbi:MAG: thioredoxin-disulfide reductase [Candidatus Omnitrophota bacterium]
MMQKDYELIIAGAGPSGLTSGLYAGRAGIKSIILEKSFNGGQVLLTDSIENFPGFAGGIQTYTLIENITRQVKDVAVEIKQEEIVHIVCDSEYKVIKTNNSEYRTKSLIIATGAVPKAIGVKGEKELARKGVSYCAVCDGALFRKKITAVVGGGDRALEEALYLSKLADKVYLIHRRDKFRAVKVIQDRVLADKKIEVIYNTNIIEIQGTNKLEQLVLENVIDQQIKTLKCDAVFIAIGLIPNTNFVSDIVKVDSNGFILTDDNFQTNISGVFASGDCRKNNFKQVITACAEGAIAANSAKAYLDTFLQ